MNDLGQNIKSEQPAIPAIVDRLTATADALEKLTERINAKLQAIKMYTPPHPSPAETKEPVECAMDDLNRLVTRLRLCNDRLERCSKHLDVII